MSRLAMLVIACLALATAALYSNLAPSQAVTRINLGTASSFAVLTGGSLTNTGQTHVIGDIGTVASTSFVGQATLSSSGHIHLGDSAATAAKTDLQSALISAKLATSTSPISGDLIGLTLLPGAYKSLGALGLTGNLILDAQGVTDAVFLFQVGGALDLAATGNIMVINGGSADNVYWQVEGAVTLGAGSTFSGTVLTEAAITAGTGAVVQGRLLSLTGAVTLASNKISITNTSVSASTSSSAVSASTSSSAILELTKSTINLGTAVDYAVFTGAALTNTGATIVAGNIGVGPTMPFTGRETTTQTYGVKNLGNVAAIQAKADLQAGYDAAAAFTPASSIVADPNGHTLTPGSYESLGAIVLTGNLTLDAQGDADATFLLQVGGALDLATAGQITIINGASPANVFWLVNGAVTLAAETEFVGTVLTTAAITAGSGASIRGKLLSLNGAITLASNNLAIVSSSGSGVVPRPASGSVTIPNVTTVPSANQTPTASVRVDGIVANVTFTAKSEGQGETPRIELVPAMAIDARLLGSAAPPSYNAFEYYSIAGILTNAAGQAIAGGTVQISAPGLLFSTGALQDSVNQNYAIGSISVITSDTGEYSVQVRSNFAGEQIVIVKSGSKVQIKILAFDNALEKTGTQLQIDAPQIAKSSSFNVSVSLKDIFGNKVQTSTAGAFLLNYSGPGVVSPIPAHLDATGIATFTVFIGPGERGTGTITASFDGDSDPTTLENNFVESRTVYIGEPSSFERKVTVGQFKGYVAVYALGYEGHRLSAKIGEDWVIVPSIPAETQHLYRWAEKVGFGVDCAVRIYMDKVLIQTVYLSTW